MCACVCAWVRVWGGVHGCVCGGVNEYLCGSVHECACGAYD